MLADAGGGSSVGRASASQAEGREFEPRPPLSRKPCKSRGFCVSGLSASGPTAASPHWRPGRVREDGGMERVLGIGGYFMRAADPAAVGAWYRDCLGLDADENGLWRQEIGPTVFATFESETDYFGSRGRPTVVNF